MLANLYTITGREHKSPINLARIDDFRLEAGGQAAASVILENPAITLYSLDFAGGQAVFVETAPDVDLRQAPFLYLAQFEHARRVLTLPFAEMIALAAEIDLPDDRMVFIHSVGRAGSTLASQIFAHVDGVSSLSEPDTLTMLVQARALGWGSEQQLQNILLATLRLHCRTAAERAWVIKGRSFALELADWLHALLPRANHLFLYRDAETYLHSAMSAYTDGVERPEEEDRAVEDFFRTAFAPLAPLVARVEPSQHLSGAELIILGWLSAMERYEELHRQGVRMMAIPFANWQTMPRETAVAMLDYCNCRPDDLTAVFETLTRDSQAGTPLAREAVRQHQYRLSNADLAALDRHLQSGTLVTTAAHTAANTWDGEPARGPGDSLA